MTAAAPVATAIPVARTRVRGRLPEVGRITLVVVAVGVALTAALTWAAVEAHEGNEERLLQEQAEEATAVLQQAVPAVLADAQAAARIGRLLEDDPASLSAELARDVGEGARFATITIDRDDQAEPLATAGVESAMTPQERARAAAVATATPEVVHVTGLLDRPAPRLAFSAASPDDPSIVAHVEQALNPDRVNDDRSGEAFEGIDVALYLGDDESMDQLLLASTADLPIDGRRTERTIPLGDATMSFVVGPHGTLGGGLLRVFGWLTAAAGLLATTIAAFLVETLHRRRRDAEAFTSELHDLYRREHAIAHTLQHSLLPTHLERLDGIEVAARYFAGAEGTDIGGDWYDVIDHPDGFTVVVGDVVGRGVQAAAIMAAMRYATHAVAGQERAPGDVLAAVNRLEHIRGDFVTMLCGNVHPGDRTVTFASAGHPGPLLIEPGGARFLDVPAGPPIGFLEDVAYASAATTVPPGSVLVLFTDGLYERRGESIEVGLERLRTAAEGLTGSLDDILDRIAEAMLGGGVRDDTAMLAFRVG